MTGDEQSACVLFYNTGSVGQTGDEQVCKVSILQDNSWKDR
jgi:hypothetical protein